MAPFIEHLFSKSERVSIESNTTTSSTVSTEPVQTAQLPESNPSKECLEKRKVQLQQQKEEKTEAMRELSGSSKKSLTASIYLTIILEKVYDVYALFALSIKKNIKSGQTIQSLIDLKHKDDSNFSYQLENNNNSLKKTVSAIPSFAPLFLEDEQGKNKTENKVLEKVENSAVEKTNQENSQLQEAHFSEQLPSFSPENPITKNGGLLNVVASPFTSIMTVIAYLGAVGSEMVIMMKNASLLGIEENSVESVLVACIAVAFSYLISFLLYRSIKAFLQAPKVNTPVIIFIILLAGLISSLGFLSFERYQASKYENQMVSVSLDLQNSYMMQDEMGGSDPLLAEEIQAKEQKQKEIIQKLENNDSPLVQWAARISLIILSVLSIFTGATLLITTKIVTKLTAAKRDFNKSGELILSCESQYLTALEEYNHGRTLYHDVRLIDNQIEVIDRLLALNICAEDLDSTIELVEAEEVFPNPNGSGYYAASDLEEEPNIPHPNNGQPNGKPEDFSEWN